MDTQTIERFIARDPICGSSFQGVFSIDTLPRNPHLLICNTDPSYKPGRHWIADYVDQRGRGEFFDSFGRPPDKHFERYMNEHCVNWTFNDKQLQSVISSFCGHYCCFYCVFRSRCVDMIRIVNLIMRDAAFNDSIVHAFVCNKRIETYYPPEFELSITTTV